MKNTLKILAAVLALSIGSAGYVASAEAATMKMDQKKMMMMMKGHHGKCMTRMRHGKCVTMHPRMMMKHPMTKMMKKY